MAGVEAHTDKKRKHEVSDGISSNLKKFQFVKVLNENSANKFIAVEGRIAADSTDSKNENKAVLLLERKPITVDDINELVVSGSAKLNIHNDCYSTFLLAPTKPLYDVKATLINPATEKHIKKYSQQEHYVIHETPAIYEEVSLPVSVKENIALDWVYNILDKKSEADRIVFEDPDPEKGFILLPDMKWDGNEIDNLYLTVIVHKREIKSIRDLEQSHLPMLKNILTQCPLVIQKKYGVPPCKLRMYCHYQPSYYYFHVHINHIKLDCPGKDVQHAHLLTDIIDNIEMKNTYYQEKTLTFRVTQNSLLYKTLREAGYIELGGEDGHSDQK